MSSWHFLFGKFIGEEMNETTPTPAESHPSFAKVREAIEKPRPHNERWCNKGPFSRECPVCDALTALTALEREHGELKAGNERLQRDLDAAIQSMSGKPLPSGIKEILILATGGAELRQRMKHTEAELAAMSGVVEAAVEAEREACAAECETLYEPYCCEDEYPDEHRWGIKLGKKFAETIRSRSSAGGTET